MGTAHSAEPWGTEVMRNDHCSLGAHRAVVSLLTVSTGRGGVKERERVISAVVVSECVHLGAPNDTSAVERGLHGTGARGRLCWRCRFGNSCLTMLPPVMRVSEIVQKAGVL